MWWLSAKRRKRTTNPAAKVEPMPDYTVYDALQMAISPVIMISAYGMLMLSMTNRLGRAVDRARSLSGEPVTKRQLQAELLSRRVRRIRSGILAISLATFFAAVLVLALFLSVFMHLELRLVVSALFVASLLCLIASLACLIADVTDSLRAMDVELKS
jgi:cobalamin biosynthesis protein CobD/CbiB